MKHHSSTLRNSLLLLAALLAWPAVRAAAQSKPDEGQAQANQSKIQPGLKPLPKAEKGLEAVQEGPEFLRRRQDWFFKPRAFPIGFIPQGARERALQQKTLMYQREGRLSLFAAQPGFGFLPPPSGTASAWFSIGPQPTNSPFFPPFTSGRVTALAVNPKNANNVYLGGADGGLWVTTDGGNTWTPLTDNPPNAANIPTVAVGAIAVDPTTCGPVPSGICSTVYVGTGEDNFGGDNIYGEGVLNCTITASAPPTASCTQDTTFHTSSPLDQSRGGPLIGALAVNRATGKNNILLAGVRGRGAALQSGVWCSSDKGVTWTHVLPVIAPTATGDPGTDVAFASDGTAWAALGFPFGAAGNGIYKSSAPVTSSCTGITWNQQTLPVASTSIGRITLALAPSDNTKIYAAIADVTTFSATLLGVVRSTNATAATPMWTQLTDPLVSAATGFCTGQCFFDMALSVDPANPAVVYAGGSGQNPIIRTTNGTTTASWTDVTAAGGVAPHVDTHALAFAGDGSKIWVGNDGGVWSTSTPAGTISWSNLNAPSSGSSTGALNITQFYPGVSIHPSNPGFAMGGSQDNGTQVDQAATSPATALIWQDAGLTCDGGFTVIDPSIPSTSYGECEYIPSGILLIGVTFAGDGLIGNGFFAASGIDGTDRGSFIPPLVVDKSNSQTLYFGTCRVWQTKNGANSWTAISPDVTTPSHPATCPVPTTASQPSAILDTIAVAPSDSNTVYVGSDQGEIEVTSNGGTTWTSIVTTTLPSRAVTDIVVDPSNKDIAYATFSGFGSCAVGCTGPTGHVFKTLNGTAGINTTWLDISGTTTKLPDIPVNAIVIDPDDTTHSTLYVGTDIGAFFTPDGGVNWSPLGALGSMPNAQILSLTLHNPSRTLRAATHGRGVWDLNLGGQASFGITSISPFTANAGASSISNFTVNGNGFTGSSTVMWGSSPLTPTTFVSSTQLTAPIPAADLSAGAVVQVTVHDSSQTPNTTNALPFTVLGPPPTISSVLPTSAPVNTIPNQSINVTGTNFGSTSKVLMNPDVGGTALATTFNPADPTHLSAMIPATFMASFGSTNSVGVQNPPPGGGTTVTTQTVTLPTFIVVAPAPANDNFANAINITSTSFSDTKDSSGATPQTNDPIPLCSQIAGAPVTGIANTIWYKVVPTGTGTANMDTIGSSYDSVLSVWSGTSQTALTAVPNGCNDDINPGIVLQSKLTNVTLNKGTTYYIMVSSFGALDPNPVAFGGKSILNFSFTGTLGGGTTGSFTVMANPNALTVTAGMNAATTITVTPANGFTGIVNVTCPAAGAAPPGVSCTPNPLAINVMAATPMSSQLTVAVAAPSAPNATASLAPAGRTLYTAGVIPPRGGKGWWALSAGTGLAAIILLLLPGRKKYRAALGLGLICVLSFTLGCGGYGGGGGGITTSATTTKLTVTSATKMASGGAFAFTVAVTGGTPTGQVQLYDGTGLLGTPVTVSGGTASFPSVSLTAVGTHSITAHYLGATYSLGSQSGPLNVTVTGTTPPVTISAASGSTTASTTITIMIN